MLNRIFSAFDELAEQHGLEKIKTIGDAYMVAGGLNEDIADYAAAIADMAIAMRDLLRRDFSVNASHLEVRIGIGTGPIVAGVLARRSSSTISGAILSTSPVALPPKASPA
jgi:adenylate cyclase